LKVEFCSQIHAAIDFVTSKRVDLIISDHHLPDSNSKTLLQFLSISGLQIPVVIVTSNTAFKPGVANNSSLIKEVLYTPLELPDLERIISSYLG
jgi:DNA-binding NtrC family response regulator